MYYKFFRFFALDNLRLDDFAALGITLIEKVITSLASISSCARIFALSGKRYVPLILSGKIDVIHLVLPIVTRTGNEPNPL